MSAGSSESRYATSSPGSAERTTLSRQPPDLRHSSSSCASGSVEQVGASPHILSQVAATSPPGPTTVTSNAPIATATSAPASAGPAE